MEFWELENSVTCRYEKEFKVVGIRRHPDLGLLKVLKNPLTSQLILMKQIRLGKEDEYREEIQKQRKRIALKNPHFIRFLDISTFSEIDDFISVFEIRIFIEYYQETLEEWIGARQNGHQGIDIDFCDGLSRFLIHGMCSIHSDKRFHGGLNPSSVVILPDNSFRLIEHFNFTNCSFPKNILLSNQRNSRMKRFVCPLLKAFAFNSRSLPLNFDRNKSEVWTAGLLIANALSSSPSTVNLLNDSIDQIRDIHFNYFQHLNSMGVSNSLTYKLLTLMLEQNPFHRKGFEELLRFIRIASSSNQRSAKRFSINLKKDDSSDNGKEILMKNKIYLREDSGHGPRSLHLVNKKTMNINTANPQLKIKSGYLRQISNEFEQEKGRDDQHNIDQRGVKNNSVHHYNIEIPSIYVNNTDQANGAHLFTPSNHGKASNPVVVNTDRMKSIQKNTDDNLNRFMVTETKPSTRARISKSSTNVNPSHFNLLQKEFNPLSSKLEMELSSKKELSNNQSAMHDESRQRTHTTSNAPSRKISINEIQNDLNVDYLHPSNDLGDNLNSNMYQRLETAFLNNHVSGARGDLIKTSRSNSISHVFEPAPKKNSTNNDFLNLINKNPNFDFKQQSSPDIKNSVIYEYMFTAHKPKSGYSNFAETTNGYVCRPGPDFFASRSMSREMIFKKSNDNDKISNVNKDVVKDNGHSTSNYLFNVNTLKNDQTITSPAEDSSNANHKYQNVNPATSNRIHPSDKSVQRKPQKFNPLAMPYFNKS